MSLFRLDASIRTEGSHSREIADIVEQRVARRQPRRRRSCAATSAPSRSRPTAWADRRRRRHDARATSARPSSATPSRWPPTEVDELVDADALLFAVPLYNFGVSQHFKTWVDLVITDPRMAAGADAGHRRQAGRARHRARRQLRRRHPARGLGPRHRLDAPHPRGRLAARPARRRDASSPSSASTRRSTSSRTSPTSSPSRPANWRATTAASSAGRSAA